MCIPADVSTLPRTHRPHRGASHRSRKSAGCNRVAHSSTQRRNLINLGVLIPPYNRIALSLKTTHSSVLTLTVPDKDTVVHTIETVVEQAENRPCHPPRQQNPRQVRPVVYRHTPRSVRTSAIELKGKTFVVWTDHQTLQLLQSGKPSRERARTVNRLLNQGDSPSGQATPKLR